MISFWWMHSGGNFQNERSILGVRVPFMFSWTSFIFFICEDKYFHFFLKFWSPNCLLNVDYEIVSKSLSLRLKNALLFVVGTDQICAVAGRSISDNVHLFRDVFDFVEQKELRYALINLDQAKAFDRVSTNYSLRVLWVWANVCLVNKVAIYKYF